MICELCGQDAPFLKPIMIEGSILKVCPNCAKFGKLVPGSEKTFVDTEQVSSGQGRNQRERSGGFGYTPSPPNKEEIIKRRLELRERKKTSRDIYEHTGENGFCRSGLFDA